MFVYSVNYDLRAKAKPDYKGLEAELKRSPGWWHNLESTWLIATEESVKAVYARIAPHLHIQDAVLVIEVTPNFFGWMTKDAANWIREHVPAPVN